MFSFPTLKSTLRFSDVEVIAFLSACLVNDLRSLETIQAIFEWKERFDVTSLLSGKTDYQCKIKETLFIEELNPTLNTNLNSDNLSLY